MQRRCDKIISKFVRRYLLEWLLVSSGKCTRGRRRFDILGERCDKFNEKTTSFLQTDVVIGAVFVFKTRTDNCNSALIRIKNEIIEAVQHGRAAFLPLADKNREYECVIWC
jgi:hypothetical protein